MAHLLLDGTGDYASSPDSAAVSVVGDIDLRARVALDDWTPVGDDMALVSKFASAAGSRSYLLRVLQSGALQLQLTDDAGSTVLAASSTGTGFADGSTHWVRVTWRNSDNRVQFFTSDDGAAWTQLGTDGSIVLTEIQDTTTQIEIGAWGGGTGDPLAGKVYRVQIYDGIDGTLVFDADPSDPSTWAADGASFDEKANDATVTLQGDAVLVTGTAKDMMLLGLG